MNNLQVESQWEKLSKQEKAKITALLKINDPQDEFENLRASLTINNNEKKSREKLLYLLNSESNSPVLKKSTYDLIYKTSLILAADAPVNVGNEYYIYDFEQAANRMAKRKDRVFTSTGHMYEIKDVVQSLNHYGRDWNEPKTGKPLSQRDLKNVCDAALEHGDFLDPQFYPKPSIWSQLKIAVYNGLIGSLLGLIAGLVAGNPAICFFGVLVGGVGGYIGTLAYDIFKNRNLPTVATAPGNPIQPESKSHNSTSRIGRQVGLSAQPMPDRFTFDVDHFGKLHANAKREVVIENHDQPKPLTPSI